MLVGMKVEGFMDAHHVPTQNSASSQRCIKLLADHVTDLSDTENLCAPFCKGAASTQARHSHLLGIPQQPLDFLQMPLYQLHITL